MAKVPINEIGIAAIGTSDARHVCRNTITTTTTSPIGFQNGDQNLMHRLRNESRGVVDDVVAQALREIV